MTHPIIAFKYHIEVCDTCMYLIINEHWLRNFNLKTFIF